MTKFFIEGSTSKCIFGMAFYTHIHLNDTASQGLFRQFLLTQAKAHGGDEQLVQVGTPEHHTGGFFEWHFYFPVQLTFWAVAPDVPVPHLGNPQSSFGVGGTSVGDGLGPL